MSLGYTEDLSDFGARERQMLGQILLKTFPEGFSEEKVRGAFNPNSGNVFLINAAYQTAMINPSNGELEIHHSTPYNGVEGFLSELLENPPGDYHPEDQEYLRMNAGFEEVDMPESWLTKPMTYRQLLESLQALPEENLDDTATVYDAVSQEAFAVQGVGEVGSFDKTGNDDLGGLDEDQFVMSIKNSEVESEAE